MQQGQYIVEETITIPRSEYEQLKADLAELKQQYGDLQRLVFGSKSERFIPINNDQLGLFDLESEVVGIEPSAQTISYQKQVKPKGKKHPVRALLPAHLPRTEEVIEPEGLEEGMKKIGEEVTEILEHVPAKLYVRRIVGPKYVKPKQDKIIVGQLPSLPIPKGNAGPGLLAHIQVSKWVDHLPFYRQVQIYKREGIKLAESTINGWFNATCSLLEPLYDRLAEQVQQQDYLQADESPIRVQDSHKQGTTHIGYHWVYHAPGKKLAVFDYQPSRSQKGPHDFLKSFQGHLQTDGYAAYNELGKRPGVTLLACMAHARRYFEKALDNDRQLAEHALEVVQCLYAIERTASDDQISDTDRKLARQEKAQPILKKWKQWLDTQQDKVAPKSTIGKAINYTLGLWPRLVGYTENGHYRIDNNLIENAIRPLALGRKNYLFAGSHPAAQRAAMMYSFFATCKLNEVEPYQWLKTTLEQIPDAKVNDLDRFLPQNWQAP